MTKYKNLKFKVHGHTFDSKREAAYYAELVLLKNASKASQKVSSIALQVPYTLIPKQDGERAVTYIADFVVTYADGREEVIDVKSEFTRKLPVYVIKRKLMLFCHGIRIKEVI